MSTLSRRQFLRTDDCRSRRSVGAARIHGRATGAGVVIQDCTFDGVAKPDMLESVKGVELKVVRVNGTLRNEVIGG